VSGRFNSTVPVVFILEEVSTSTLALSAGADSDIDSSLEDSLLSSQVLHGSSHHQM
jgi:hypothetical protein